VRIRAPSAGQTAIRQVWEATLSWLPGFSGATTLTSLSEGLAVITRAGASEHLNPSLHFGDRFTAACARCPSSGSLSACWGKEPQDLETHLDDRTSISTIDICAIGHQLRRAHRAHAPRWGLVAGRGRWIAAFTFSSGSGGFAGWQFRTHSQIRGVGLSLVREPGGRLDPQAMDSFWVQKNRSTVGP